MAASVGVLRRPTEPALLEFGGGFSYVGPQVHFDVEGDGFYVDLLLFQVEQLRYVVIELKIGTFKPDHLGQLGCYVAVVDDRLRRPGVRSPTVGILLYVGRNDAVVHYALTPPLRPLSPLRNPLLW